MKRFRNIQPSSLIASTIITLAYPIIKAATATGSRLLAFSDALTIVSLFLLFFGVFNHLNLKGDFDLLKYLPTRWMKSNQSYDTFRKNAAEEHAHSFNYPLFLGIVSFLVSLFISYVIY